MARRATTRAVAQAAESGGLRVAIYIRRSTDEEHQPFTLEAQQTKLGAYITSQPGWHLVAVYSDDASGAKLDRPGLHQALAAARAGQFDILLVYRLDRFTRRIRDLSYLIDELDSAGVAFRSATEPFDTATPAGRMMVQMLAVFAEFERAMIIDRVVNGMERKAAKGRWTLGTTPYGYTIEPTDHVLVRHRDEAAVVVEIFRLYTYRRLGTRAIATRLNERGLRRRSGRPWSHKTVADVLVNRVYLGEIHFRDIVVDGAHPAIIDAQTFDLAERILTLRGENPAKKAAAASDYHVTGKIPCPLCGRRYLGTNATGRSRVYRYYTCATRSKYGVQHCPAPRIDADALDEAILHTMASFCTRGADLLSEAITAVRDDHRKIRAAHHDELAVVTGQLAAKEAAVDKYLSDFEDNTISQRIVGRRVALLTSDIDQLRHRRDALLLALDVEPETASDAELAEARQHLVEIIRSADLPERQALCDTLIEELRLNANAIAVPVLRVPTPT
jgi:site-specific DNA recombinase